MVRPLWDGQAAPRRPRIAYPRASRGQYQIVMDRARWIPIVVSVALGALVLGLPATVLAQGQPKLRVDKNTMVAMRDGVRLATDVYRPDTAGTFPAILVRSPYNKDGLADDGRFFAAAGYVFVAQDTRGRYASEGTFNIYVQDDVDGFDAAQWLNGQSWSSPDHGFALYGGSYLASTALSAAEMNPPNLKALYVSIASANYHEDGAWRGGAFQLAHNVYFSAVTMCPNQVARGKSANLPNAPQAKLPLAADTQALFSLETATPLDQRLLSDNCPWYRDWALNSDQTWYWNQPGLDHVLRFDRLPKIPMAFLGGWYDQFLGGTIIDYQGAPAGQPVSLTIGPWVHGDMNKPVAGDGFFGKEAALDQRTEALHWFNRYMKGGDSAGPQPNSVRYFLMGGGSGAPSADPAAGGHLDIGGAWRTAPAWPLPTTQYVPYYLGADGTLGASAPGAQPPDGFDYDPRNPVPTIGGNISSGSVLAPAGAYGQRCRRDLPACNGSTDDLLSRPDILTYQTEPLAQDATVVGPLSVRLWAATSAADTDFTAKLVDVYPNGAAINIADGIVRARYARDRSTAQPVTPGTPTEFAIDLWHTAVVFKAGHRMRLDISSSNFPHYDRNLNSGATIGSDTLDNAVVASQTVFHDAARPSRLLLPVIDDSS